MASYKEGQTVIVHINGTNQVGVILGKLRANKKTVYDVLLESRSVIPAVTIGKDSSKFTYIDPMLTRQICIDGKLQTTIPYKDLQETGQLPNIREVHVGPRSF